MSRADSSALVLPSRREMREVATAWEAFMSGQEQGLEKVRPVIRESWLRAKATARAIPCTFIGKHLRFSDDDIAQIMAEGARQPVTRARGTRR